MADENWIDDFARKILGDSLASGADYFAIPPAERARMAKEAISKIMAHKKWFAWDTPDKK